MDVVHWSYWSMAEISRQIGDALSQGAVNPQDHEAMRDLLQGIRHWNRTEDGKDRKMLRPGQYEWQQTLKAMTNDANPRLKGAYGITSSYVHPTYRGPSAPDPGVMYVMEQAIWITAATIIICGASMVPLEDQVPDGEVEPCLLELIGVLGRFLSGDTNFAEKIKDPPDGITGAQVLYLYGAMLLAFVFGRDIIEGQPRFV